jgi:hypothetical protein
VVGRKDDNFCSEKNILLWNPKKWKPDCVILRNEQNLAESSKEGYGSRRAVLPVMIMKIALP